MESWLIWAAIFAGGAFGVLLALLIAAERELRRYKEMEAAGDPFSIASGTSEGELEGVFRTESRLADFEKERSQLLAQIAELKDQNEAKQERILKLKSAEGQRLEGVDDRLPELEKRVAGLEQERSQLLTQVAELRKEVLIKEQRIEGLDTAQQRLTEMQKRVGEVEQEKSRLTAQVADLKREAEIRQGRIQRLEGLQQRLSEMERQVMELLKGLRLVLKGEDADVSRGLEANK